MTQDSTGSLIIPPRSVATGAPAGDALENVNTSVLANGVMCYVAGGAGQGAWQLQKESTTTPDGTTIVSPIAGPGRWFLKMGPGLPFSGPNPFAWYSVSGVGPGSSLRANLSPLIPDPFAIEGGNTLVLPAGKYFAAFYGRISLVAGAANGYNIQLYILPTIPTIPELGLFSKPAPAADRDDVDPVSFTSMISSNAERRMYVEYTSTPTPIGFTSARLCVVRLGDV